jgi:hypothetical protein
VDEPPSKVYKFIGKPSGFSSRKLLYEAIVDAQNKGKAHYWPLVKVVEDEEKDAVLLQCTLCSNKNSSRNPADSVGKHFVIVQDVGIGARQFYDGPSLPPVMKKRAECCRIYQPVYMYLYRYQALSSLCLEYSTHPSRICNIASISGVSADITRYLYLLNGNRYIGSR